MDKKSWKNTEWKAPEVSEEPVKPKKSRKKITSDALAFLSGKKKRDDVDEEAIEAAHKILIGTWF